MKEKGDHPLTIPGAQIGRREGLKLGATSKLSARAKLRRAIFFTLLMPLFASSPLLSMAEQSTSQQSNPSGPASVMVGGAAGETIAAEGELKATVRTFQGGNPSAVYRYYWWREGCYVRYPGDKYELVSSDYCHQSH